MMTSYDQSLSYTTDNYPSIILRFLDNMKSNMGSPMQGEKAIDI